jgi:peroxiredoxin
MPEVPAHPQTLDGSAVLHQMCGFDWAAWRRAPQSDRDAAVAEFVTLFQPWETGTGGAHPNQSAVFAQLGHKGDLLFVHHRDTLEDLAVVQRDLARTALGAFLQVRHSYVSLVELGLYDSSLKIYQQLADEGIEAYSEEWQARVTDTLSRQAAAMAPRLYPAIPDAKYLCFYPMDKKRGEQVNWYTAPIEERVRMMHDHGAIGRRFAGRVRQIISGSIGFDDWEWGVDLYADDPAVFKQLVYEMRFDAASAAYGAFGQFHIAVRLYATQLAEWLALLS